MDMQERMQQPEPYVCRYFEMPHELQKKAKRLCWEYNQTSPDDGARRSQILHELLGTCQPHPFIQPTFQCDYGFNIHVHGVMIMNHNCVFLDTSPIHIGHGAFIGPGTVLACSGHSLLGDERMDGIGTSAPITLCDHVWLGANVTVIGGVTIGEGSMVGAGSVVTRDIPAGVVAAGNPCRVIRPITQEDRLAHRIPDDSN